MSTRSQVIVKDGYDELWFYRHSDGYPSGQMEQLFKFMTWVNDKKIRNNAEQSAGWLILIGADEYGYDHNYKTGESTRKKNLFEPAGNDISSWKCGAYEPCSPKEHEDIEWLYTIDLTDNSIKIKHIYSGKELRYSYRMISDYKEDWERLESEFK